MSDERSLELNEKKLEDQATRYYDKYRPQMDALEKSVLARVHGGVNVGDVYSLGKQLEQWESYQAIVEEEGNVNLLGRLPNIAFDVITAVHGVSILPVLASVQPIDEERGTVYFKNVRASTTKGSVTLGQSLQDPRAGSVTAQGYSSNKIQGEVVATTASSDVSYTFTLAHGPIRSESVVFSVQDDAAVYAQDLPTNAVEGRILGVGLSGVINYLTGVVTLNFAVQPAVGKSVFATYQQNLELSTDLPQISSFFDSKAIQASVYALKGTVGMLQSYGMRKRFGLVAEDELAKDLVSEINKEIGGDLIKKLAAAALGQTTWNRNAPSGVSYFEHKQTFKDALAVAESTLTGNAGRGTISMLTAGREVCAILSTLPGFVKLTDGNTLGAHVYGTLDGVTVIRVLEQSILDSKTAIATWKGPSPFESAAVYAPFMPLAVTATLPMSPNPLNNQKAAAVWAGVEALVPNFATKFVITDVAQAGQYP